MQKSKRSTLSWQCRMIVMMVCDMACESEGAGRKGDQLGNSIVKDIIVDVMKCVPVESGNITVEIQVKVLRKAVRLAGLRILEVMKNGSE